MAGEVSNGYLALGSIRKFNLHNCDVATSTHCVPILIFRRLCLGRLALAERN